MGRDIEECIPYVTRCGGRENQGLFVATEFWESIGRARWAQTIINFRTILLISSFTSGHIAGELATTSLSSRFPEDTREARNATSGLQSLSFTDASSNKTYSREGRIFPSSTSGPVNAAGRGTESNDSALRFGN